MSADLKIVELPTKTEPPAKDYMGIGDWMHRYAKEIERGEYPYLERMLCIRYSPDGDDVFALDSCGSRVISRMEAIAMLELMLHKMKSETRL